MGNVSSFRHRGYRAHPMGRNTVKHPVSPYIFLHLSRSLTVARVHSKTLHPCSSNQCDTARLESKLSSIQIMFISSHEHEHSFSNETQRLVYRRPHRGTKRRLRETRSVPHCSKGTLPSFRPLITVALHFFSQLSILYIFSATHLFTYTLYFSHDDDD